jgi:hypothetical protein
MSYKFWIINYADQDLPWLVSDYLVEENRNQIAQILHLNSRWIIPLNENSIPETDQKFLQSIWIKDNYDSILNIVTSKQTNNLIRKFWYDNNNLPNTIQNSIAYTPFDTSDKFTDNIEHCLRILITATQWTQYFSALTHLPAYELWNREKIVSIIEPLLQWYCDEVNSNNWILGDIFVWGWSLAVHKNENQIIEDEYFNGIKKVKNITQKVFDKEAIAIMWPKWQWKECIIVETQKQRAHILRPRDDMTISNQSF